MSSLSFHSVEAEEEEDGSHVFIMHYHTHSRAFLHSTRKKGLSTKMSHVVPDKYLLDRENKWFGASFMEMILSRSFDRWLFLFWNSGENCLSFVQGQTVVLKTPLFTEFMCWEYL